MSHTEPRQTAAYGETSPTPEGKVLFPGFKNSKQLEGERGKKLFQM